MKHEREIFEEIDEVARAASIERSRADFAAGRYYSHELVSEWLRTWSQPGSKPFREWLAERNG